MIAKLSSNLFDVYRVLRIVNPSPYMYLMQFDDLQLAGASPETLVKVKEGIVTTMPIAGIRPRGKTEEEDKKLDKELLSDPKELAEHNMLVDLARNDIGKISEIDSVEVTEYMALQKFSHVTHISSMVQGKLNKDCALFKELPGQIIVGRYHSLIVDKKSLTNKLEVMAEDNEGEIMALKYKDTATFGLQFQ